MDSDSQSTSSSTSIPPPPPPMYPRSPMDPPSPRIPSVPSSASTEKTPTQKKAEFETIVKHYLESNPLIKSGNKSNELEIRFGTNPRVARPISKIDYDNVVQHILSNGFKTDNMNGVQMLRIQNEYIDKVTGRAKPDNIRAEVVGVDLIQEYCKTNNLQKLIDMPSTTFNKVKFTKKMQAYTPSGEKINKVDMEDFNFRVSFQTEQDFHAHHEVARSILSKWDDTKKYFRIMNRVQFYHDMYPVVIDMSIVRSSKKMDNLPIQKYTIQEAEVFDNVESYEIEIEVDSSKVGPGSEYNTPLRLTNVLRKCIRIILCGIQGTQYPISYKEKNDLLQSYMRLVHGEAYERPRRVQPKDFIGPGSYTLQMENMLENPEESKVPNIRNDYTVTDKADGDRKLLYISEEGNIYLIDTNMNVMFTGAKTGEKTLHNSLLDGEHIKYDKNNKYFNMYAAFDVYYVHGKSIREFGFIKTGQTEEEEKKEEDTKDEKKYRLPILYEFIKLLKPYSIMDKSMKGEVSKGVNELPVPITIKCKEFYSNVSSNSIFSGCSKILSNLRDGLYEYNTDGLIFTPASLPVGGTSMTSGPGPLYKTTWEHSFKWKPAEFNTIDFLVSVKKDKTGKDEIHNIFQEGKNMQGAQNIIQYKTLILRCGFDEKKHGYLNPFNDLIHDNIPSVKDIDDEDTYKPVAFQPTNPFDKDAAICNIMLKEDGSKTYMMTEEGDYFDENTIVEFKYIPTNEVGWRWVPLRMRHDKTTELLSGKKNYGNAYHVANSNWHSIHNPITEEMITTGTNIPETVSNEDVYYNRASMETSTQSLRNFHNLYVKSKLITSVSNRGDTLIDYAVGKAGDLAKWKHAKLGFVFGIDISKDNIMNQLDGACTRYLKEHKKYEKMPNALFLHGDSGKNIRNGSAYYTEKDKQISKAVFGAGAKDASIIGKGVYKNYGKGESGFQISSCQFAMHYFFENEHSVHEFLRNVAECTKVNGRFIGTCYDGKTVFNMLKNKNKEEGVSIFKDDYKMFELTKMYDQTGFPDDEASLGYAINVYQESINKVFREYLVNFDYLIRLMEDYGFVLITDEEASQMNLPGGSGLFSELYTSMQNELKMNPKKSADYKKAPYMSPEEKRVSFLNRYFVFKKVRNVDVQKMSDVIKNQRKIDDKRDEEIVEELKEAVEEKEKKEPKKIRAKKTSKKITLKKFDTPPENVNE
jgi:hypothetical protein